MRKRTFSAPMAIALRRVILTGIAGLLACGTSNGTAIYDFSIAASLDFSHPWVSVSESLPHHHHPSSEVA